VKQNVLCETWHLIKNGVVPVGVSDVASFEVFLLSNERGACPGCIDDFQAVFDSGEAELFDDLNGVRLWGSVNAVAPCEILFLFNI
jgi:hypothetical protein